MPESFTSGMKDVMSIFMMSALASNYDAQRENMDENRKLREANLQRQAAEDKRQAMQADISMLQHVSNPKSNIPLDIAVKQANTFAVKYGYGDNVPIEAVQKYDDELTVLTKQDLPTGEERRALFQPYAERAGSHVAYALSYGKHAQAIEDWLAKPGAVEAYKTAGFTPAHTERLLTNLRPGEGLALLKDGDYRKAALYNQATQVVAKVMNGEDVPEGELSQVLSAAYGAGFKVGPDAAEIVKGTTGEQQYNVAQKDLNSLDTTTVKPFVKLWDMLDQEKVSLALARRRPDASLTTIGLSADDHIARTLPEELQKPFHEYIANIEADYDHASKTWKDFEARYKIAKANPNTSQADIILLDQQRMIEHQKYRAHVAPFIAVITYRDAPTAENFQKVRQSSDKLQERIRTWEADKQHLMTVSEQKTQQEIATGKMTAANTKATNEFGTEFMRMVGEHPEIYDVDGVMDISKASKLAAPIADAVNAKYGANLDASQIIKEFAAAAKRSTPKSDTNIKLTAEEAGKFEMVYSGWQDTQLMAKQLVNPDGTVNRKELAKAFSERGVPWTSGRDYKSYAHSAIDAILRPRTGAAVKEEEWPKYESMYMPVLSDSDETIIQKLERLDAVGGGSVNLVDPQGILRKRIPGRRKVTEIVGKEGEPAKAAPGKPAPQSWDQDMESRARALLKAHPDWGVEQIYKELRGNK